MCDNNNTQSIADYLAQLLKDKKQLAAFPNVFLHLERLLDDGKQPTFLLFKESVYKSQELHKGVSFFQMFWYDEQPQSGCARRIQDFGIFHDHGIFSCFLQNWMDIRNAVDFSKN